MGLLLMDQYTYLHFASGIIAYFWGVGFWIWMLAHVLFEAAENTPLGMELINRLLKGWWPGGKPSADGSWNILGDNVGAAIGWASAWALDMLGSRLGWYSRHIK